MAVFKFKPNPEKLEGLFDEALSNVPEGEINDFMDFAERLATNPHVEVIRDARGRPVLFRKRQH